jgi:Pyruvate/2-oxoacid:ferredoxin oxidoreductase delta subunit
MTDAAYRRLAQRLNELPDGFPATQEGSELRLLEALFTPDQAQLASLLRLTLATPQAIAAEHGLDLDPLRAQLKEMARKGLIAAGRTEAGLGYGLMPFVVGIYEMQAGRIDHELAERFEAYYQQAFVEAIGIQPSFHRVLPVHETIQVDMDLRPYESTAALVEEAQAWGVVDCICRVQKSLVGEGCDHPLDVCMVLSAQPGAFDNSSTIKALDRQGAMKTLRRAADAGLVHTVSNHQEGHWYICNCCACSCGILRGLKEFGVANVVAHSSYLSRIDEELCVGCELCLDWCQFEALTHTQIAQVEPHRCVGCGVCVLHCPEDAIMLVERPASEIHPPPSTLEAWRATRARSRGINLGNVL